MSTDFSVDEAILVEGTGYEPLGLVTGAAIYRPPFWGRYGVSMRENRELVDLSDSLHSARTIAMGRLRAEAAASNADGVVGVRLEFEGAEGKGRDYRFQRHRYGGAGHPPCHRAGQRTTGRRHAATTG